ncbi:MAG: ABC transporter permease [Thalassotalea sp.]
MSLFIYQLKQALLSLKQSPIFVFSVVSTMGIALGALLCVVTLNYLLLVKPLPYPDQERLYVAEHNIINAEKETQKVAYSYPGLVHLYKSKVAFEQAAMVYYGQDVITSHSNQPLVNMTYVTPEFHQMLASPIAIGRMFEASEALNTNNPVALLSYNTWQREFNGRADILEKTITLSGISYRIVGVLAKYFTEPTLAEIGHETQIWLPWDLNPESATDRKIFGNIKNNFKYIGQLKKGLNSSQVQQLLTPLVSEHWQEGFAAKYEFFEGWSVDMQVRPVREVILGGSESITIMLLAGVVGLVLIATTNISNLFMSRTAEKQRQLAVQAAIGASRSQLFKTIFAETSLLMLVSIVLALGVAQISFYLMQHYLGGVLPRVSELSINLATLSFTVLVTLFFALFFAKVSIRTMNYNALNKSLQSSGKGSGLQVSKKTRHLLIASQVALATVLVFVNVGLLKSAMKSINTPIGFSTHNISTLILNYSAIDLPSEEEIKLTMAQIMEKLAALPQVTLVAQGSSPLDGFAIKALTKHSDNRKHLPYFKRIDQRYFTLIEQPFLAGENFTVADRRDNNNVMIVNQAFAKQLTTNGDAIGMRLSSIGEPDFKIIGIVEDIYLPGQTAFGNDDIAAAVPRSYAPNAFNEQQFMLKIKANHSISRQQLGKLLSEVDARYSVLSFNSASNILIKSLFSEITMAVTTATLAIITFSLANIGLYGILSCSIQMRRFEIGTRMAVGAKGREIITTVIKENASAILMGVAVAGVCLLGLYLGFHQYLSQFIGVQLVFVALVTLLAVAAITFIACYLPLKKYISKPVIHCLRGAE